MLEESVDYVGDTLFKEIEEENFETETVSVSSFKYDLKKRDGRYLPKYIRNLSLIKSLEIRSDDAFIIGYPKSGTTWVEELVWLIKHNADIETANNKYHFERVIVLDRGMHNDVTDMAPSPRVFKTHLLPQFLPQDIEKKAKVIYVVRNPKDMMVSQYNFFKNLAWDQFEGNFNDIYELFLEGKLWYGPWWEHVDQYADKPDVKVVHYEDLLMEPFKKCKELCEFLNADLSDAQIELIMGNCSFEIMKKNPALDFKKLAKFKVVDENVDFFKNGKIGQWQKHFTKEMCDRLEETLKKNLNYNTEFTY